MIISRSFLLLVIVGLACSVAAATEPTGIVEISRGKLVLTIPPDRPSLGSLRYALAFPFQAGPHTVGLMVSRMIEETSSYGFLDGSDVILLDELKPPCCSRIFAVSRNELEAGGNGTPASLFVKSPLIGGFVPYGARRADGTPHPHAGTGFGVGQAHRFPFSNGRFSWTDAARIDMNEVYQLAYNGETLLTRRTEVRTQNADDPLPIGNTGWSVLATGGCNATADGDDLLLATTAANIDRTVVAAGVMRWICADRKWRPTIFIPVVTATGWASTEPNLTEQTPWMEPSLTRDADGSLLFSVRGNGELSHTLALWRLASDGVWRQVLNLPDARMNSPVSVNTAADGSAYLVSNPYNPSLLSETAQTGRGREKLVLWPLNSDRTGVGQPLAIRDCLADFGEPPLPAVDRPEVPEKWMADHANGVTVRLNDGGWHHVLAYRVCHGPPYSTYGTTPSPQSGAYIEEVVSRGSALPVWRFADDEPTGGNHRNDSRPTTAAP